MKHHPLIFMGSISIMILLLSGCVTQPITHQYDSTSLHTYAQEDRYYFDKDLSPWGEWIIHTEHGRVWRPHEVSFNWRPYTSGHWTLDNNNWLWNSDFSWGSVVFHYGRWFNDSNHGWLWIAGRQWAPAWVSWRHDNDWVGWAPLTPAKQTRHASPHRPVSHNYHFVRRDHFTKREISRHIYAHDSNRPIFENTREVSHYPAKKPHFSTHSVTKPANLPYGHAKNRSSNTTLDKVHGKGSRHDFRSMPDKKSHTPGSSRVNKPAGQPLPSRSSRIPTRKSITAIPLASPSTAKRTPIHGKKPEPSDKQSSRRPPAKAASPRTERSKERASTVKPYQPSTRTRPRKTSSNQPSHPEKKRSTRVNNSEKQKEIEGSESEPVVWKRINKQR